jgi:hypothetical protein
LTLFTWFPADCPRVLDIFTETTGPPFVNGADLFVDELCSSTKRLTPFVNGAKPPFLNGDLFVVFMNSVHKEEQSSETKRLPPFLNGVSIHL